MLPCHQPYSSILSSAALLGTLAAISAALASLLADETAAQRGQTVPKLALIHVPSGLIDGLWTHQAPKHPRSFFCFGGGPCWYCICWPCGGP